MTYVHKAHELYLQSHQRAALCKENAISWCQAFILSSQQWFGQISYQSLALVLLPILIISLVLGMRVFGVGKAQPAAIAMISDQKTLSDLPPKSSPAVSTMIKVDVSGAVNLPGVKTLFKDARVDDALKAADGYSSDADVVFLAEGLNLAQKLNDGDKIFIPKKNQVHSMSVTGQKLSTPGTLPTISNKSSNVTVSQSNNNTTEINSDKNNVPINGGLVSINNGTQSDLESLPGIGPAYAKAIIAGRPYLTTEEMCLKKVIKNSVTCQKIQSLITL